MAFRVKALRWIGFECVEMRGEMTCQADENVWEQPVGAGREHESWHRGWHRADHTANACS